MFSVALSVGSRPPGVTWHPALWSPDFPPPRRARGRLSGRLPSSSVGPAGAHSKRNPPAQRSAFAGAALAPAEGGPVEPVLPPASDARRERRGLLERKLAEQDLEHALPLGELA